MNLHTGGICSLISSRFSSLFFLILGRIISWIQRSQEEVFSIWLGVYSGWTDKRGGAFSSYSAYWYSLHTHFHITYITIRRSRILVLVCIRIEYSNRPLPRQQLLSNYTQTTTLAAELSYHCRLSLFGGWICEKDGASLAMMVFGVGRLAEQIIILSFFFFSSACTGNRELRGRWIAKM